MKKTFLVLSTLLLISCCCAAIPQVSYNCLVGGNSHLNKNQLFDKAEKWMHKNLDDAKTYLRVDDSARGVIQLRGTTSCRMKMTDTDPVASHDVGFTLTLFIKDGVYSGAFTDYYEMETYVTFEDSKKPNGFLEPAWLKLKGIANGQIRELAGSLEDAMR